MIFRLTSAVLPLNSGRVLDATVMVVVVVVVLMSQNGVGKEYLVFAKKLLYSLDA